MIEFFSAYIKTIVSLLLFSVFAEILMPEGGYKKYLKLLTGLIITLTVLKPVTYMFGVSEDKLLGAVERKTDEIWGGTLDFVPSGGIETLELQLYKEEISKLITEDAAKKGLEVEKTQVAVEEDVVKEGYGNILEVKIYTLGEKGEGEKQTANYIGGKYGVPPEKIEFIYQ